MAEHAPIPTSRLVLGIGLIVLVGTPLVGYLWYTLNDVFAGEFRPIQVLMAIPVAILLYGWLRFMGRRVNQWDRALHARSREEG